MVAYFQTQAHLFEFQGFGLSAVLFELLSALVVVFTPVDYFGYGRISIRGNYNQIESSYFRCL
jgi:hypothetical protein